MTAILLILLILLRQCPIKHKTATATKLLDFATLFAVGHYLELKALRSNIQNRSVKMVLFILLLIFANIDNKRPLSQA
ncbi:hypothetical protein INT80_08140 [Gallibacterium anatis]|uniref:Uncharacterized protein n=1 Tax=Gallibacterium anatis TaxID=750 RepID=A0A930UWF6_9PAST|nr:hypothetical protein [Gallibacterium anatis]